MVDSKGSDHQPAAESRNSVSAAFSPIAILYRILRIINCGWRKATLVVLCLVLASASEPAMVAVIKYTVDWGKVPVPAWIDYAMLPIVVVLIFIVRGTSVAGANHLLGGISADLISSVQAQLHRYVLSKTNCKSHGLPLGRIVHLLTFEVKQFSDLVERIISRFILNLLSLIALYASLFSINWAFTLIASLAVPMVYFVCKVTGKHVKILTNDAITCNAKLVSLIAERSHKTIIIKLHSTTLQEMDHFEELAHHMRRVQLRLYVATQLAAPLSQVLVVIVLGFILLLTVQSVGTGSMTKGDAAGYFANLFLILLPLKYLAELTSPILRSIYGAQTVFEIEKLPRRDFPESHSQPPDLGCIKVSALFARYSEKQPPVLRDINFQVDPGELVAIVGPSGAGKSSLLKALIGELITDGEIHLNGRILSAYNRGKTGLNVAMVPQQCEVFPRSVLENVAYGDENPDISLAWSALEKVQLASAIRSFPLGIYTCLGRNGVQLSIGQIRLIAIARALYARAPIILLDEPTASLDKLGQRAFFELIRSMHRSVTLVLITHNKELAMIVDRVISVNNGRIDCNFTEI